MFRCEKMFRALLFVMAVVAIYAEAAAVKQYSGKYDFIDIDKILSTDRLRNEYYDCFMETRPCITADAKFFAGIFAEALVTKCLKCTDKQKIMVEKIVEWYTTNRDDQWKALLTKILKDAKAAKSAATS